MLGKLLRKHGDSAFILLLGVLVGALLVSRCGGERDPPDGSSASTQSESRDTAATSHDARKLADVLAIMTDPKFNSAWSDIAAHEGFRSAPYRDAEGNLTIGMGLCIEPEKCPLSRELAEIIMRATAAIYFDDVRRARTQVNEWPDAVQVGAMDAIYNLGVPHFLDFRRTLQAIDQGHWTQASRDVLDSHWYRDVNTRPRATAFSKVLRDQASAQPDTTEAN